MRIVKILSHYVSSLLAKQHPLFSCCASCGEIRTPVENRLCTSLSPAFSVDMVCLVPDAPDAHVWLRYALRSLERHAPWVQRVFLVAEGALPGWLNRNDAGLRIVPHDFFPSAPAEVTPEALLYLVPDLEEHHLILSLRTIINRPCLVQDFFTPNGIPLLFVAAQAESPETSGAQHERLESLGLRCLPGVYAQTKENAAAMHAAFASAAFTDAAAMTFEDRRTWWTYTQGRAIPHVPHCAAGFSPDAAPSGMPWAGNALFFQGRVEDEEGCSRLETLLPRPSRLEVA